MKNKKNKAISAIMLIAVLMSLGSCTKEKIATNHATAQKQATITKQHATADEFAGDMHVIISEIMSTYGASFKTGSAGSVLGSCEIVTVDSNAKTATIDFGTGCVGNDGKTRSGILNFTYNNRGKLGQPGTYVQLSFQNFYQDGDEYVGTMMARNDSLNGNGNYTFTLQFDMLINYSANSGSITRQSNLNCEWLSQGTQTKEDDFLSFTGTTTGVENGTVNYTETIITPLIINRSSACTHHFVSGTEIIQRTNQADELIDYGNGRCDDVATSTINGQTTQFTIQPFY